MTPQELRTLVDYHYWALDRLLAAVERLTPDQFTRDLGNSFPSVRDTLAHLQGAEWICDQCQKRSAVYKVMVATGAQLTLCGPCAVLNARNISRWIASSRS